MGMRGAIVSAPDSDAEPLVPASPASLPLTVKPAVRPDVLGMRVTSGPEPADASEMVDGADVAVGAAIM
jgi:hypothetical protein